MYLLIFYVVYFVSSFKRIPENLEVDKGCLKFISLELLFVFFLFNSSLNEYTYNKYIFILGIVTYINFLNLYFPDLFFIPDVFK